MPYKTRQSFSEDLGGGTSLFSQWRALVALRNAAASATPVPSPYPTSPGTAQLAPSVMLQKSRLVERSIREMAVWTYEEKPETLRRLYELTKTPYRHRITAGLLVDNKEHDKTLLNVLCGRGLRYSMMSDPISLCIGLWKDHRGGIPMPEGADTSKSLEDVSRIWYKAFEAAGQCCYIDVRKVYKRGNYVQSLYKKGNELGVFDLVRAYAEHGVPAEDLVG